MLLTFNCNYDVAVANAPFCMLDETQEQHIGHGESFRRMMGSALALFKLASGGLYV